MRKLTTGWQNEAGKGSTGSLLGKSLLLLGLLAGMLASSVLAQAAQEQQKPGSSAPSPSANSHSAGQRAISNAVSSSRQALLLRTIWGIEDVHVRYTASGSMVRFSYRVVDADKASVLNDKKLDPYMIVQKTGAKLEVPETEKVGKLRQTAAPRNGREYWMVFTNAGRIVKPGDHVDIVIGTFRAPELIVEPPQLPRGQKP